MSLKRSDVVITRPGTMEEYQRYRATALGWGFLPEPDRRGLPPHEEMLSDVEEAHRCDVKFQGRVELDADWMGMIDYDANFMESVVRDFEGNPVVTWWVHTYKGHPAYYYCTNAPRYRDYLMYQVRRVIATNVDWLMIDCAIPTIGAINAHYGGCFCEHCMIGFRDYLAETLTTEQLQAEGIDDINTFDYRDFLSSKGYDSQRYRADILAFPPVIPLAKEYFDYQRREITWLFNEFKRYAGERAGRYVPMSSNSPHYDPMLNYAVEAHDFYTNEMTYHPPETEVWPHQPVYLFKLADAIQRLVAITGIPSAFEPYRLNDRPGHIQLWIAQAYAFGHVFMVPVKMWTIRTKNEPDRWYYSKPGDYEGIYHFIRDYPALFDEYESVVSVALVYSNQDARRALSDLRDKGNRGGLGRNAPDTQLLEASSGLALANVPHCFILAGDEWMKDQLLSENLSRYDAVVRFEPSYLSAEQEDALKQVGDRLVTWSGIDMLLSHLTPKISIEDAENVVAAPRFIPDDDQAPAICHLLNQNYQMDSDTYCVQHNFKVSLAKSLFGRTFSTATWYALGKEPLPLDCQVRGDATQVTVPALELWGILKLE
jgi:hypothetical protein